MKQILIVLLITGSISSLFAQERKIINGAIGKYVLSGSTTPDEARTKATAEAKLEALRMAGVVENITSYEFLFKSEIGSTYEEVYMADIQSEVRGSIQNYSAEVKKGIDAGDNFYIEVSINAEVLMFDSKPDPSMYAKIEGIKPFYADGLLLSFTVTTSHDCFLTIFNLFEKNAGLTYPNSWEEKYILLANETYNFPSNMLDYPVVRTIKNPEKNKMIFVFTKDDIPYTNFIGEEQETKFEDISAWLFSIPPDRRYVQYHSFVIY